MEEKSREEILAERKLRKAAKLYKKKGPPKTPDESQLINNIKIDCTSFNFDKLKITPDISKGEVSHSVSRGEISNSISKNFSDKVKIEKVQSSNVSKIDDMKQENCTSVIFKNVPDEKNLDNTLDCGKSKSQLRAERRAKQEAQRALKVQKKNEEKVVKKKENPPIKVDIKLKVKTADRISKPSDSHKMKLFSHLYRSASSEEKKILANSSSDIHKAIVKLGIQYKNKVIIGSNARVIALLNALKQVISEHQTPAEKDFSRGFEVVLAETMLYLNNCRLSSVSMTNAVKFLKSHLSQLSNNITDHEAQIVLRGAIDDYIKEQIDTAGKAICIMVQKKISEDDVILTFGYSSLIERILVESNQVGVKFRVIIVDAGPLYEGKELLRRLVKNNINCIYVLLSAASYIMKEANKVLLGAHALLTNGYVMSRAGSSQVALIAKSYNVPVLVCCETHKFSERVQTDAFVHNELGDAEKLMEKDKWKNNQYLTPLTLMYEVTPSDLVTAVVTELAILPCTSVPVVLRVKPTSSTL